MTGYLCCLILGYILGGLFILIPSILDKNITPNIYGWNIFIMFIFWPITVSAIIFASIFYSMKKDNKNNESNS